MKCIKCQTDNKLKDRKYNNGKCKNCRHPFTFDPKISASFTDRFFANVLTNISVNNSIYFTPRQFFYFFNARKKTGNGALIGAIVSGIAALFLTLIFPPSGIKSLMVGILILIAILQGVSVYRKKVREKKGREIQTNFEDVKNYLAQWQKNNGVIERLLLPPEQRSMPVKINQEISAYSFDRAVICDREEIAHFLIANNFHFENNCAVLSVNGYPRSIFEVVLDMLKRNPELKVYALHDASPTGVQLVHRLRSTPRWFAECSGVTIFDLGFLPRQLFNRRLFVLNSSPSGHQAQSVPPQIRETLQAAELQWLDEGNYVELESLSPMMILKVLREGIAKSRNPEESDALVMVGDSGGYVGSDVSVYSIDSFG